MPSYTKAPSHIDWGQKEPEPEKSPLTAYSSFLLHLTCLWQCSCATQMSPLWLRQNAPTPAPTATGTCGTSNGGNRHLQPVSSDNFVEVSICFWRNLSLIVLLGMVLVPSPRPPLSHWLSPSTCEGQFPWHAVTLLPWTPTSVTLIIWFAGTHLATTEHRRLESPTQVFWNKGSWIHPKPPYPRSWSPNRSDYLRLCIYIYTRLGGCLDHLPGADSLHEDVIQKKLLLPAECPDWCQSEVKPLAPWTDHRGNL